jgi:spoIIIJ-associated protein
MEWVETTAKTVDEAKEKALDQLGVHMEDAEFEVLEEPKAGLFGRVRGEARVRARVKPAQVRQKMDRRDRRRSEKSDKPERTEKAGGGDRSRQSKSSNGAAKQGTKNGRGQGQGQRTAAVAATDGVEDHDDAAPTTDPNSAAPSSRRRNSRGGKGGSGNGSKGDRARSDEAGASSATSHTTTATAEQHEEHVMDAHQVGEEASRFMAGLLDAFGLEGSTELIEDGDDLEVRVHGNELGLLVGPRGTTLQAVQDLARVASQRRLGDHDTRLRIDVGGYRERRRAALGKFAQQMADEVKESGVARVLEPMSSADRKVIHDTLSEVDGIATRSEGDDPYRRVVIAPAND